MNRDREEWLVNGVLHGGDVRAPASLLRGLLTPLAALHRLGLSCYLAPFHLGLRKRYRLPVPVISVGNLSSGGTGKTPATALIAGHLRDMGKRVVILSRGHRGAGERTHTPRVVSDGTALLLAPSEAGDEPILLASLLPGVPVIVCRDRRSSGKLAVERFAPDVIVLDDGLQYWQLHRDLDVVLLDARAPFDNGFVLPRGLLREPPSHLARAGVVLLTRADRVNSGDEGIRRMIATVQRFTRPGTPILTATHAPVGWVFADVPDTISPIATLAGRRAVVFSGIAGGDAFAQTVASLGVNVTATRSFGDHHEYTDTDLRDLVGLRGDGDLLVTTEKDAVKVVGRLSAMGVPLASLRIALAVSGGGVGGLWERVEGVFRGG